jgi:hypothetical protein
MNKKAFFILVLALLALQVLLAHAKDDGSKDDDGDKKDPVEADVSERKKEEERRDVRTKVEDDRFELESESRSEDRKDKFLLKVKTESSDHARAELKYYRKQNDTFEGYKFRVDFVQIVEYRNSDDKDEFDPSVDQVVSTYRIGRNSTWERPSLRENTLSDGTVVRTVTFRTSDNVFYIEVIFADTFFDIGTYLIQPDMVKLSVGINDYPYRGASSDSTRLALLVRLKYESTVKQTRSINSDGRDNAVQFGSAEGFFTWLNDVTADGRRARVKSSRLVEGDDDSDGLISRDIYFSYLVVQPDELFWDPIIGVGAAPKDSASSSLVANSFLIMALLFVLSLFFM